METKFFKSSTGHWIKTGPFILDVAVSTDGINFQMAQSNNASYTSENNVINIEAILDCGDNENEPLSVDGERAFYLGETYLEHAPPENQIKIISLPEIRVPFMAAQTEDGAIIYISKNKYGSWPFKAFSGIPDGQLEPLKILSHENYKDGGSIYFQTEQGEIGMPYERSNQGKGWYWKGKPITKIDLASFQIDEEETGVRFTEVRATNLNV